MLTTAQWVTTIYILEHVPAYGSVSTAKRTEL
jgi:hypothetical protein